MVLIQVLLPTTFPNGAASQEASAALADTRRELAETCLWVDRLCPLARQGRLDRTRRPCGTRRCRDGGGRSVQKLDRGPSDAKPWAVAALIPCGHGSALASAPVSSCRAGRLDQPAAARRHRLSAGGEPRPTRTARPSAAPVHQRSAHPPCRESQDARSTCAHGTPSPGTVSVGLICEPAWKVSTTVPGRISFPSKRRQGVVIRLPFK